MPNGKSSSIRAVAPCAASSQGTTQPNSRGRTAPAGKPDALDKRRGTVAIFEAHKSVEGSTTRSVWITLGALLLHGVIAVLIGHFVEEWSFLESVYFAIVTLTTVGYGDIAPKRRVGRLLTAFYILYGFVLIAWAISSLTVAIAQRIELLKRKRIYDQPASRMPYTAKVCLVLSLLFLFGMVFFTVVEDLSLSDSFYFAVVTLTTVGYGDIKLTDQRGQAFLIIYLAIGTVTLAKLIGDAVDVHLEAERKRRRESILRKRLSITELFQADADESGSLTEAEFIVFKFQQMGIIKADDLRQVQMQFFALDQDANGCITMEEAKAVASQSSG